MRYSVLVGPTGPVAWYVGHGWYTDVVAVGAAWCVNAWLAPWCCSGSCRQRDANRSVMLRASRSMSSRAMRTSDGTILS